MSVRHRLHLFTGFIAVAAVAMAYFTLKNATPFSHDEETAILEDMKSRIVCFDYSRQLDGQRPSTSNLTPVQSVTIPDTIALQEFDAIQRLQNLKEIRIESPTGKALADATAQRISAIKGLERAFVTTKQMSMSQVEMLDGKGIDVRHCGLIDFPRPKNYLAVQGNDYPVSGASRIEMSLTQGSRTPTYRIIAPTKSSAFTPRAPALESPEFRSCPVPHQGDWRSLQDKEFRFEFELKQQTDDWETNGSLLSMSPCRMTNFDIEFKARSGHLFDVHCVFHSEKFGEGTLNARIPLTKIHFISDESTKPITLDDAKIAIAPFIPTNSIRLRLCRSGGWIISFEIIEPSTSQLDLAK